MKIILDVDTQFMGPLTQGIKCQGVRLVEQPDGSFGLALIQEQAPQLPAEIKSLLCGVCGMPLIGHTKPCQA